MNNLLCIMATRPLTAALAEKAKLELNEDPKTVESDLNAIKDWIQKQPHLTARTDDQWLIGFLRGCKYSLERVKEKIDLLYTLRTTAADLVKRMELEEKKFQDVLNLGVTLVMPKPKDCCSTRLVVIRCGAYDVEKYNIRDIMFVYYVILLILLKEDDQAVICGIETVLDLENVTMGHFLQMSPALMAKCVSLGQDAMPFRLKGTHFINTPPGFETIFNLFKSFLNEKNKSRLYVHNRNYEELYKRIPKEILPEEYGGNAENVQEIIGFWNEKIERNFSWLKEEEKFGTDEGKRVGTPKTTENMFGVEGSFRQLQVD